MGSDSGKKDKEKVEREKTAEEMDISATNGPGNEKADSQQQPEENTEPPQLTPPVNENSGGGEGREAVSSGEREGNRGRRATHN